MNEEYATSLPLFGSIGTVPRTPNQTQGLSAYHKESGAGAQIGSADLAPRLLPTFFPSLNGATYLVQYNGAPLGWWRSSTGWVVPSQPGYNGEMYQHLLTDQLDAVGERYTTI